MSSGKTKEIQKKSQGSVQGWPWLTKAKRMKPQIAEINLTDTSDWTCQPIVDIFEPYFMVIRPHANRASRSLVKFLFGEEDEHEEAIYGTANHRVSEGS
ncbi:hypothetical protein [Pandoraea sputorum]|uniref:hypothetical protein n=1 Tax=Pandoraea sputorum TaxID=93222 RepID=UPI002AF6B002|nr:hypothetical protein [Pandoraea sputorum]